MGLDRRAFVSWLSALVPAVSGIRVRDFLRRRAELDVALTRALANAVLPTELGAAGARRVADAFVAWTRGYRAGAELSHGYGTARIRTAGADPSVRWALQLQSLDETARRAHSASFTAIMDEQRRTIVRAELNAERNASLATVAGAQHVAVALLAHFYDSPEATDLCYDARIGRLTCRPLSASPNRPVPLRRGGAPGERS